MATPKEQFGITSDIAGLSKRDQALVRAICSMNAAYLEAARNLEKKLEAAEARIATLERSRR